MRRLYSLVGLLLALIAGPSLAANCPSFTYTLTNGTTADANQVMANFNTLLNCSNNNLAHSGTNADIITASVLTTAPNLATIAPGAAVNNIGYTPVNKAGDTMTGFLTAPSFATNGAAGTLRQFEFQTAGLLRWNAFANTAAEGVANAGSDFALGRYSDAGSFIDSPIFISRATGLITVADGLTVVGGIAGSLTGNSSGTHTGAVVGTTVSASGGFTGNLTGNVTGNVTGNTSGSSGSTTGNAATATALQSARSFTYTGDVTGGPTSFDGSGNVSTVMTAASTAVTPGSYTNASITVDAKGRLTAASNGAVAVTVAEFQEQQTAGTGPTGGILSAAWTQRPLTTTLVNNISGASLSSNQVTLPAGTYQVRAFSPAGCNSATWAKIRLRNVTDSTTTIVGGGLSCSASAVNFFAPLSGTFIIGGSKTFEVDIWTNGSGSSGSATNTGEIEVYTDLQITKVG